MLEPAQDGDPLTDPTTLWPQDRERVPVDSLQAQAGYREPIVGTVENLHPVVRQPPVLVGIAAADD